MRLYWPIGLLASSYPLSYGFCLDLGLGLGSGSGSGLGLKVAFETGAQAGAGDPGAPTQLGTRRGWVPRLPDLGLGLRIRVKG